MPPEMPEKTARRDSQSYPHQASRGNPRTI